MQMDINKLFNYKLDELKVFTLTLFYSIKFIKCNEIDSINKNW